MRERGDRELGAHNPSGREQCAEESRSSPASGKPSRCLIVLLWVVPAESARGPLLQREKQHVLGVSLTGDFWDAAYPWDSTILNASRTASQMTNVQMNLETELRINQVCGGGGCDGAGDGGRCCVSQTDSNLVLIVTS